MQVFDRLTTFLAGMHKAAMRFSHLTGFAAPVLCRNGLLPTGDFACSSKVQLALQIAVFQMTVLCYIHRGFPV